MDRDLLLNESGEMVIRNGTFAVGESLTQEVSAIMLTNQGEVRHDLFCGCNLRKLTNSRISRARLEAIVRLQLERDGKNWSDIARGININLKHNG